MFNLDLQHKYFMRNLSVILKIRYADRPDISNMLSFMLSKKRMHTKYLVMLKIIILL
jgi:hypothetical protein